MSLPIAHIYRPVTAAPFRNGPDYQEVLPCAALQPYIRCFWRYRQGCAATPTLSPAAASAAAIVVPDTCVDVLFTPRADRQTVEHRFCGINDHSFWPSGVWQRAPAAAYDTFAIRFYAWSVHLFAEDSLRASANASTDARALFPRFTREIEERLPELPAFAQQIAMVESLLMRALQKGESKQTAAERTFLTAVSEILYRRGNLKALQLARQLHLSSRQLERVFLEYGGVSPKKLATLVRYQSLWQDVLFRRQFHIQDEVYELGFSDQSHLLHEFRRFHAMSLGQARAYAYQHVDFLQSRPY